MHEQLSAATVAKLAAAISAAQRGNRTQTDGFRVLSKGQHGAPPPARQRPRVNQKTHVNARKGIPCHRLNSPNPHAGQISTHSEVHQELHAMSDEFKIGLMVLVAIGVGSIIYNLF